MASATDVLSRSHPFGSDLLGAGIHRSMPIIPTPATSKSSSTSSSTTMASGPAPDPMETTPTSAMGPPALSSPMAERDNPMNGDKAVSPTSNGTGAIGAAAAASQPKVVQTAFIHKLYNMLEDQTIQHLISWSHTNESFVMSPSTEFSKVLSSYFKHTNISSFVRQLNMYGFHKVSDVFHNGQPDSPLWEFKHGNGNFKRGDLVGLREIKRRASKHALIHRDSFSAAPKTSLPPQEAPMDAMPHSVEARLNVLEHNYFDMHARLARSEDQTTYLSNKCLVLSEGLMKCHQWNQDLATYVMAMIPDQESQIHKDVAMMQREIARQTDMLRTFDEPPAPPPSARDTYFNNLSDNVGPPLSPRQMPAPDRRPSQPSLMEPRAAFRLPIAPHLAVSPRRYGSFSSNSGVYTPNSARQPPSAQLPPPPPPAQHPLATVTSPPTNLPRRHTSADIRQHGWNGIPPTVSPNSAANPSTQSPYASGHNSTNWPSSPHRTPLGASGLSTSRTADGEVRQIREALASYELPRGPRSRGDSPSPNPAGKDPHNGGFPGLGASALPSGPPGSLAPESAWQLPGARFSTAGAGGQYGKIGGGRNGVETPPGPLTRRSSLASNVHSLLNPVGSGDEEEGGPDGERKRKRVA